MSLTNPLGHPQDLDRSRTSGGKHPAPEPDRSEQVGDETRGFCVFCSLELISTATRERNSLILRLTNQGWDHRCNLGWNMHCIDNHCLYASASASAFSRDRFGLAASPRRWPAESCPTWRGDARLQGGCNWDLTAGEKLGQDCQCVCKSNGERAKTKEKKSHIFRGSGPFHDMGSFCAISTDVPGNGNALPCQVALTAT